MKTLNLKSLGLMQMTESENQMVEGGCGLFWCAERIAYEAGKIGDAFSEGFDAGFKSFTLQH